VFLVNSRLGLFTAAPSRSRPQGPFTLAGRPFSRSYGANLPSSLTRAHPFPLVRSYPATRVGLRYGRARLPARGFSRGLGPTESSRVALRLPPRLARPKASCTERRGISGAALSPASPVARADLVVRAR